MKSMAAHVGEKVTGHIVQEQRQEVSPPFNWMHALHQVGDHYPADRVQRNEHTYSCTSSPPPVCLAFDAHPKDQPGPSQLLEWSTVHHTTVRSTAQTRTRPFSIYGTSSDNTMAGEVILEGVLLSPISGLGSLNIPAPLNYTTMIWERIPASEGSSPKGAYLFHTASQESYYDFGDEMDSVENEKLSPTTELNPVLPMKRVRHPLQELGTSPKAQKYPNGSLPKIQKCHQPNAVVFLRRAHVEAPPFESSKEETRTKYHHIPSISISNHPKNKPQCHRKTIP